MAIASVGRAAVQFAGRDLFLGGVIPKPCVFFSGERDLARIATPSGIKLLLYLWDVEGYFDRISRTYEKPFPKPVNRQKRQIKLSAADIRRGSGLKA
jgi:hypothetical protein